MAITRKSPPAAIQQFAFDVLRVVQDRRWWEEGGPTISELQCELRGTFMRNHGILKTERRWVLPPIVEFRDLLEQLGFRLVHESRPRRCTRVRFGVAPSEEADERIVEVDEISPRWPMIGYRGPYGR